MDNELTSIRDCLMENMTTQEEFKKSNDEYISDDYDDLMMTQVSRGHVTDTLENLDRYSNSERLRNNARMILKESKIILSQLQ